jgi:inorganic pyrophosphatase
MSPFEELSVGEKAPEVVNVVIEIPKGSHNKFEYDEKLGVFKLDRVLFSPFHYPLDYGFIPGTRSEDGDHLDALVIGGDALPMGCVLEARPIGMMKMIDGGDLDFKILAVQAKNPRFETIKNLKDIEASNPHLLKELAHFFETYKDLEGKKTKIQGWEDLDAAKAEIKKAQAVYEKEQNK